MISHVHRAPGRVPESATRKTAANSQRPVGKTTTCLQTPPICHKYEDLRQGKSATVRSCCYVHGKKRAAHVHLRKRATHVQSKTKSNRINAVETEKINFARGRYAHPPRSPVSPPLGRRLLWRCGASRNVRFRSRGLWPLLRRCARRRTTRVRRRATRLLRVS